MNQGLINLGTFVRDLLSYDEQLIRIGRSEFEREDFQKDYIVIDSIGPLQMISRGSKYNGDSEDLELTTLVGAPCTLNFYGHQAFERAAEFMLRVRTQESYEIQRREQIGVYNVSSLTDVKALTGQQYGENIELSLLIKYNLVLNQSVKRIDTLQFSIIDDITGEVTPSADLTPWIDSDPWIDSEAWTD